MLETASLYLRNYTSQAAESAPPLTDCFTNRLQTETRTHYLINATEYTVLKLFAI